MAPSSGRFRQQASLDAALRYGPQRSALRDALLEAQRNYGQTVRAGNSSAYLTEQAAKAAKPEVAAIYSQADAAQRPGATLVSQALAGLPGVADQFKADSANEVQQQLANLISARASAETALHQRGVAAHAGAQFNQNQAHATLGQAIHDILTKQSGIAGEEGAFKASELDKFRSEAEQQAQKRAESQEGNRQQERASERSANTSRENAKESNAAKAAGPKLLSTDKQASGAETVRSIEHYAREYWRQGASRSEIEALLAKGVGSRQAEQKRNGKPVLDSKGKPLTETLPGRGGFPPGVLMQAAIDSVENYGQVTKGTLAKLHNAGYSLKALSLAFPNEKGVAEAKKRAHLKAVGRALQPLRH